MPCALQRGFNLYVGDLFSVSVVKLKSPGLELKQEVGPEVTMRLMRLHQVSGRKICLTAHISNIANMADRLTARHSSHVAVRLHGKSAESSIRQAVARRHRDLQAEAQNGNAHIVTW